ncbi:hypothetical protein FKP32DRAFT_1628420, partial [Trametes sanguinea]
MSYVFVYLVKLSMYGSRSPDAVYVNVQQGVLSMSPRKVTRDHLDRMFQFRTIIDSYAAQASPQSGDLVIRATLHSILQGFDYVFHVLHSPRPNPPSAAQNDVAVAPAPRPPSPNPHVDAHPHLAIVSEEMKRAIITEWEESFRPEVLSEYVCAVCGRDTPSDAIACVEPSKIDFALLCNDNLPEMSMPTTYNRAEYGGAILHPKGLIDVERVDKLYVCKECSGPLQRGRMPRFALANWLYYGYESLPGPVKQAFDACTHIERMLVSRARSSRISYKFSQLPGHYLEGTDHRISQGCVKGNIAVHPQDATHLNNVLPPGIDQIRDSVCVVFVGGSKPTRETIRALKPMVVRKSRVKRLVEFLTRHNPWYTVSEEFQGFSQENLDTLFGPGTSHVDEGVPCSVEIGHIQVSDAVEGATEDYVPGRDDGIGANADDMLIETVGYTDTDDSPVDYNTMTMCALRHCLKGGSFIKSQAGSRLIPDFENSQLLSWLFPHLDPWGIGGFYDCRRRIPLSLSQHLKYLLMVHDSPFKRDPDFAFVYYNIRQKRAVFDSMTFRVAASERMHVTQQLLNVNVQRLDNLIAAYKANPHHRVTASEDKAIVKLLLKVNAVAYDLPGSNGYKVMLRNQIRALINFVGSPTLFITLNPSDRDHPLVRFYAGHSISLSDEMPGEELSRWQRTMLAAGNPSACARFFDKMICQFINVILGFNKSAGGLFG